LTFSKIAYFGQGDVKAFASLTDAELKQVFEQALGLTAFTGYQDKIKQHKSALDRQGVEVVTGIKVAEGEMANIKEKIEFYTKAIEEAKEKHKKEQKRYVDEMQGLEEEVAQLRKKISLTEGDYIRNMALIEGKLDKHAELFTLKKELDSKYRSEVAKLEGIKAKFKLKQKEAASKGVEIKTIKEKVGTNCGECGKTVEEVDINDMLSVLSKRLDDVIGEANSAMATVNMFQQRVDDLDKLSAILTKKLESFDDVKTEKGKLEAEKKLIGEYEAQIVALRNKREHVQALIDDLDKSADILALERSVTGANVKRNDKEAELDELRGRLVSLRSELEGVEMLCEIMGNGGLKSYIFDSITPELNKIISEYIEILNPDISVEISTVSKLKSKDEYREKFQWRRKAIH